MTCADCAGMCAIDHEADVDQRCNGMLSFILMKGLSLTVNATVVTTLILMKCLSLTVNATVVTTLLLMKGLSLTVNATVVTTLLLMSNFQCC